MFIVQLWPFRVIDAANVTFNRKNETIPTDGEMTPSSCWVKSHWNVRHTFIYSYAEPRKELMNSFALSWWFFVLCRLIRTFALFGFISVTHTDWGAQWELSQFRQRLQQNWQCTWHVPLSTATYQTQPLNVALYWNWPILRLPFCLSMHVRPHHHCTSYFSPTSTASITCRDSLLIIPVNVSGVHYVQYVSLHSP